MTEQRSPARRPTQRIAVEITTSWEATPLGAKTLGPPAVFWVGEEHRAEPCDVPLGREVLGIARLPLVVVSRRGVVMVCLVPDVRGTIELPGEPAKPAAELAAALPGRAFAEPVGARLVAIPRGTVADLRLGPLSFRIVVARPMPKLRGRRHGRPAWLLAGCCALSLAVHTGVGAASYLARPLESDPATLTDGQRHLIRYYLDRIEERRLEMAEESSVAAGDQGTVALREGGTGSRARGARADAPVGARGARYAVAGPTSGGEPYLARQQALSDAAEFGMIGLSSVGAGGDADAPAGPWGQGSGWGGPPSAVGLSAIGHGAGTGLGRGFGSGLGRGGGGTAAGLAVAGSNASARRSSSSAGTWAPALPVESIDPHGRFSTTYRPGRGHLAAFEAALAQGALPPVARELVADVAARYAPKLPAPSSGALAYAVELERSALAPGGGPVHLRLAFKSAALRHRRRAPLSVHLLLDQSGSMSGEPLERAKQAASMLVGRLQPHDEFSLITFDDAAEVRVPVGFVGPRRSQILAAIGQLETAGGTNIGEGLAHAYRQARARSSSTEALPVVLLLSDGQATVGERDPLRIAAQALEAFQDGIQTSTFGLGNSYDGSLMSTVASDGAGGYYYLRDAEHIGAAFRAELEQRLEPAATALEIRVKLAADVELRRVYGSRRLGAQAASRERAKEVAADRLAEARDGIDRDRKRDDEGGMRFFVPAFARNDSYALLLEVDVPSGRGERELGTVELRYKDRVAGGNAVKEQPIVVRYADDERQSAASIDPSVARTVQGHRAGEDLLRAAWYLSQGDRGRAVAILAERESLLREAARQLDEPAFDTEAHRFASLVRYARGELPQTTSQPYALAMMLETAGRARLR